MRGLRGVLGESLNWEEKSVLVSVSDCGGGLCGVRTNYPLTLKIRYPVSRTVHRSFTIRLEELHNSTS